MYKIYGFIIVFFIIILVDLAENLKVLEWFGKDGGGSLMFFIILLLFLGVWIGRILDLYLEK